MHIRFSAISAAILWAAVGAVFAAAPATGPGVVAASQPATVPMDPFTRDLLAKLNSTNPAQREAAQKDLLNIAGLLQQPEALKKLQEIATDPDLKDFFGQRQTQIRAHQEELRLKNLPPISLKLQNAPFALMVQELNKAVGQNPMNFVVENNGNSSGMFSIEVKDKPFWEVFAALQEQQSFEVQNYGGNQGPRLIPTGNRYTRKYVIDGPVMVLAASMSYQRSINFQMPNSNQQPNLNMNLMCYVDPRVRATRYKNPTAVKMVDDEGRAFQTPNNGSGYNSGQANVFNFNISAVPLEKLARTFSLSFDSAITTTAGDTKMTIDDLYKNIGKPYTMGNRTVQITQINGDGNINVQLSVQPINDGAGRDMDYNSRIPFSVVDANGRTLTTQAFSYGTMGFNFSTNGATGPYKLEAQVPGRSFDIPFHIESKELPLP